MNWERPKVYAGKHKDEATRAASRSGGILQLFRIWFYPTVVWSMGVF